MPAPTPPPASAITAVLEWLEATVVLGKAPPGSASGSADVTALTYAAGRSSVLDDLRAELRRRESASQ